VPLVRRAFGVKRESFLGSGILYSPSLGQVEYHPLFTDPNTKTDPAPAEQ